MTWPDANGRDSVDTSSDRPAENLAGRNSGGGGRGEARVAAFGGLPRVGLPATLGLGRGCNRGADRLSRSRLIQAVDGLPVSPGNELITGIDRDLDPFLHL